MSRTTRHAPAATPAQSQSKSIIGQPVSEVLSRIQVRDSLHKPSGIYGRRVTDYESHVPFLFITLIVTLAVLVAGPFGTTLRRPRPLVNMASPVPVTSPRATNTQIPESLSIPPQLHPRPEVTVSRMKETPPAAAASATSTLPDNLPANLRADFLGPRSIEFQWDAIGPEYTYLLYSSQDSRFKNPSLLSKAPLRAPSMAWFPDDTIEQIWVAVKGVDSQGHETPFSHPLLVQLPAS